VKLLLDIGNSRIKWACLEDGELHSHGSCTHQGDACVEAGIWGELATPDGVYCASVAAEPLNQWVERRVQQLWGVSLWMLQSTQSCCDVRNGYRQPEALGVDRWAVLLGARELSTAPLCVVDCGSAVTVDVLERSGQHLGGFIIPGLKLQQALLHQGTAAINTAGAADIDDEWGRDTASCLELGSVAAVAGLIEHCLRRLTERMCEPVDLFITGGDAQRVLTMLDFTPRHEEHLVLLGMARMIRELGE
jgi:type III pantothenate kinase